MITLENINKTFYTSEVETRALEDINLTVEKGEFVAIMGPSGCGKSTMLNIMGLLDKPTSGWVIIDDVRADSLYDRDMARIRNQKLGFIFQSFHLIPSLNVLDNVLLPMLYRRGSSASANRKRALELIEKVGLTHRLKHFPSQLSGGQCQRVAIARALMKKPEIYVFDDSFSALDMKTDRQLRQNLKESIEDATVIMVAQRISTVLDADRILVVDDGQIVGNGTHRELLDTCPLYREIAEIQLGKEAL